MAGWLSPPWWRVVKLVAVALSPAAVLFGLILVVVLALGRPEASSMTLFGNACTPQMPVSPVSVDLSQDQWASVRTIVAVGQQQRVPSRGWVIAVATAMQESGLLPLPYGDRDSLGLFQQRPGWGS